MAEITNVYGEYLVTETYLRPVPKEIILTGEAARLAWVRYEKSERKRMNRECRSSLAKWDRLSMARKNRKIDRLFERCA